jgi:hypothetical protein
MKVAGAVVRGVSMMYATTVGRDEATASVIMAPDADQVNISICPGVSSMTWLQIYIGHEKHQKNYLDALYCIGSLLHQPQNLIELCREQIERRQYPTIRS